MEWGGRDDTVSGNGVRSREGSPSLLKDLLVLLQLMHALERRRGKKGNRPLEEPLRFERLLTVLWAGLRAAIGEILEVDATRSPPKPVELILEVGRGWFRLAATHFWVSYVASEPHRPRQGRAAPAEVLSTL